jgi:hypothetical protein
MIRTRIITAATMMAVTPITAALTWSEEEPQHQTHRQRRQNNRPATTGKIEKA